MVKQTPLALFIIIGLSLAVSVLQAQVAPPSPYGGNSKVNFVRTWDAVAPESDPNTLMSRSSRDTRQTTQYFDGLGRPLQTVIKQGSMATGSTATDMVSAVEYD